PRLEVDSDLLGQCLGSPLSEVVEEGPELLLDLDQALRGLAPIDPSSENLVLDHRPGTREAPPVEGFESPVFERLDERLPLPSVDRAPPDLPDPLVLGHAPPLDHPPDSLAHRFFLPSLSPSVETPQSRSIPRNLPDISESFSSLADSI